MVQNSIDVKVLGQLMLMQSVVINLPDLKSIFGFVKKGLKDIPGVSDVNVNTEITHEESNNSIFYFPISQNDTTYGEIVIHLNDPQLFYLYTDHLKNFVFMLGVILEERKHRQISLNYQDELEKKVKERTNELKREKESLLESQRRFNDLMSNVTLLSVMLDTEGNIIFCNNYLLEVTGYSYDEIIHRKWFDIFIKEELRDQVFNMFKNFTQGKPMANIHENEIFTKNGDKLLVVWNNTALYDLNKQIIGTASIGVDVTKNRQNEKLLKQKNEEYETLNEELKQANEELWKAKEKAELANRLKTEFLRNMSHEIRTPMNGIIGFSDMIDEPGISAEKRQYFSKIVQNSSRQLLKIIDDILEISTLETKKVALYEEPFYLNDFLMQLFSVFELKAKERSISLYLYKELPDEESYIICDKTKLNKILSNLIENAIKYTFKGYVEIKYFIKDDKLNLAVKDTGIGISGQNQELVFERFAQEDKELSNKKGGLGLGLSIAKENAELLRGNISLESGKGKGSTFTLSIPYKKAGVKSTDEPKISKQIFTILIAEDEEINYMYLSEILRDRFKTIHAKNGKEAIDLSLKSNNIDLILMDIKMPDMDGHQATRIIKENNPRIPIIAQTAYSSIFDKKLSLQSGCDDFISKPINKDELLDMIDRYLSNTGSVLKN